MSLILQIQLILHIWIQNYDLQYELFCDPHLSIKFLTFFFFLDAVSCHKDFCYHGGVCVHEKNGEKKTFPKCLYVKQVKLSLTDSREIISAKCMKWIVLQIFLDAKNLWLLLWLSHLLLGLSPVQSFGAISDLFSFLVVLLIIMVPDAKHGLLSFRQYFKMDGLVRRFFFIHYSLSQCQSCIKKLVPVPQLYGHHEVFL